jgi:CHAT domain
MSDDFDRSNGDRPLRIVLIDIAVRGELIAWDVFDDWSGVANYDRRDDTNLELSDQRRRVITLLADLLQFHSDQDKADRVSKELYKELLAVVGQQLFDLLFVGQLRQEVSTALKKLRVGELNLLRIKLWFSGTHERWLASLPWEYVRTPASDSAFDQQGLFLSQHAELVLSRRVQAPIMRKLGQDKKGFTVLLVSPNPTRNEVDTGGAAPSPGRLDPVDPRKLVEYFQTLHDDREVNLVSLVDTPPEHPDPEYEWVTRDRLRRVLDKEPKPVIVHFLGHGRVRKGRGELLFATENGTQDWVDDQTFTDILAKSKVLKLVFLQACESASAPTADQYVSFSGVARNLAVSGVPAVIGMQYRIKAETSTKFASAFYESLIRSNVPVDLAVEKGRQEIQDVHNDIERLAFGLPVLYLAADHQGLTAPVTAAGINPVSRGDSVELWPCPRCGTSLRSDAIGCRSCLLKLRCMNDACREKPFYPDPLRDRVCEQCFAPANQPPWDPDQASGVETPVTSAAGADAARAVLSVLRPARSA